MYDYRKSSSSTYCEHTLTERARYVPQKNDRIDARCIAEIIRTEPKSDYYLTDEDMLVLRQLTRLRVELVELVSDQKRRLLTLLDQGFPEFETLFREKYCKSSLALLQTYPTPADMLAAGVAILTDLLSTHSRKRYGHEKAEEIQRAAERSFGIPFGGKNPMGSRLSYSPDKLPTWKPSKSNLTLRLLRIWMQFRTA